MQETADRASSGKVIETDSAAAARRRAEMRRQLARVIGKGHRCSHCRRCVCQSNSSLRINCACRAFVRPPALPERAQLSPSTSVSGQAPGELPIAATQDRRRMLAYVGVLVWRVCVPSAGPATRPPANLADETEQFEGLDIGLSGSSG